MLDKLGVLCCKRGLRVFLLGARGLTNPPIAQRQTRGTKMMCKMRMGIALSNVLWWLKSCGSPSFIDKPNQGACARRCALLSSAWLDSLHVSLNAKYQRPAMAVSSTCHSRNNGEHVKTSNISCNLQRCPPRSWKGSLASCLAIEVKHSGAGGS